MPPPLIAFDVTPLQNAHRYRGIGTYVRGLARRLAAQTDIPIEFWGWAGDGQLEVSQPHRAVWLPRRPTPQYRGAWIFAQLAMRQRAGKSGIGVVHVTDPDALASLTGRKVLVTVYDLIPLKQPQPRRRVIANVGYWSYLNALRRAHTLFAISEQTASDLVEMLRLPSSRILVTRPGVDLPSLPTRGEVPGEQGPPRNHGEASDFAGIKAGRRGREGGRPYFLYVGGPNPNKNLALILDAMALCTDLSEELRVAGHWLPKQVQALNAQLAVADLTRRVRHIGFVPLSELADLMRDATALVIPSLHEGFGLPVAEGLAAGAVVMHSDLPVLRETSAGAALIFSPRSADGLATCMRQAAGNTELNERLRRLGLERAKTLTWDDAVDTTLAAYRAAVKT